jgi:hypothetical protein
VIESINKMPEEAWSTISPEKLIRQATGLVRAASYKATCDVCAPIQGRIFSISGKDKRFPALSSVPGFDRGFKAIHPNCRHRLVPIVWEMCTEEEQTKYLADAGKPVKGDTRGAKEVEAYHAAQAKNRKLWQDRRQWEKYKATLGDEAPKTFSAFRKMKNTGGMGWDSLQEKYRVKGIIEREKTSSGIDFSVDFAIINSKSYKAKFSGLFNAAADEKIYSTAKRMLQHRDGTPFEDLYLIDIKSGKITGVSNSATLVKRVEYNKSIKGVLTSAPANSIVSMHNHPEGFPPSAADINAVKKNSVELYGMVIGHNGTVYRYTAPRKHITNRDYMIAFEGYKNIGYSEETCQLKALRELEISHGFKLEVL